MKYDHKQIEKKWQKYWLEKKIFKAEINPNKPKYYILDMFPYPSGSGLHVGHVEGYTATDIVARYKRQLGFNVLHPMGWDSFGLPAEQYAVRTGTHPAITTQQNIDNFRQQLQSIGFSYDWDREFATSDPSYYKWTQWIFTKLYERDLAYEAELFVNFCPALGTVLANEEVDNGRSKEGGFPVEKRPLRQWVLRITSYAERLLQDLDLLDWPDHLKRLQINWIGKSEGALVDFPLENGQDKIRIFTTRPDTLFGATYLALAPEHPFVAKISTPTQAKAVRTYQEETARETELDRTDITKNKTGVFTGAYAINPVSEKRIPIWISDYVLMGYGTGAIMAVPSDDERDRHFAEVFQLPIIDVFDSEGKSINSEREGLSLNGQTSEEAKKTITQWLEKRNIGKETVTYKLRDWLFSRQRYWGEPIPILHFEDGKKRALDIDELPLCPPQLTDFKPSGDGQSPLAKVKEWVEYPDPKTGKKARRETNTMPQWAGSCWYYLRFCDPYNTEQAWSQEAERYWDPVDLYVGGVEHAVLHLLYARFWHKVLFDCGLVKSKEPFQTLRNQGIIVSRSYQRSNGLYVSSEDVIERDGLYFDRKTGEQLTSQIEKMSKSKLNGVTPDEVINEYGADALRLYEMFMGPLEKEKVWNTDAVSGCRRFLDRFYDLAFSDKLSDEETPEALRLGHRLVHAVARDIEEMQFNTAIAKMMEFMNEFTKLTVYPRTVLRMITQTLMPFAPHLAEEIWQVLGCNEELSHCPYPTVDPKYLEDSVVTYVVQVNGKLRGRFDLPKDQPENVILEAARKEPAVARQIDGKKVLKVVFVPNRLLNIVVE